MMATMTTTTTTTTSSSSSPVPTDIDAWPWMKDAKCRLAHPIPLVDEYDKRPLVSDLIEKHRGDIDRLKSKLSEDPLYQRNKHDDLWILRFLLSHSSKSFDKALEAAKSTLAFRQEHSLDEADIRGISVTREALLSEDQTLPWFARACGRMLECYDEDHTHLYTIPDAQRGPVGYLHLAGRNPQKMAAALTEQDYFAAHLFFTEWKFQWTDFLTRTTGRLTKYLSVADMQGASQQKLFHPVSKKLDSQAAKSMEDKYPQLLGNALVCHAPKWIHLCFALVKPFAPRRLLEKVDLIKPASKQKDLTKLLEHVSLEHLPERYGGTMEGWPCRRSVPI